MKRFFHPFALLSILYFALLFSVISCTKIYDEVPNDPGGGDSPGDGTNPPNTEEVEEIVFAAIGDFGNNSDEQGEVVSMMKSWNPDFIITMGDNNYSDGEWETIEENVTQYFCEFIYNPDAPEEHRCDGPAAQEQRNRFFPSIGNHDHRTDDAGPHLEYFTLPGNEEYYDFVWGAVHFFAINSSTDDELECCDNPQAQWLKDGLQGSSSPFKIVYFHHAPYATSDHGNEEDMQWPFEEWGASAVITGHEHVYERIHKLSNPNFPYFVNGTGGKSPRNCGDNPLPDEEFSGICRDGDNGAMKCIATKDRITFQYFEIGDPSTPKDEFVIDNN